DGCRYLVDVLSAWPRPADETLFDETFVEHIDSVAARRCGETAAPGTYGRLKSTSILMGSTVTVTVDRFSIPAALRTVIARVPTDRGKSVSGVAPTSDPSPSTSADALAVTVNAEDGGSTTTDVVLPGLMSTVRDSTKPYLRFSNRN